MISKNLLFHSGKELNLGLHGYSVKIEKMIGHPKWGHHKTYQTIQGLLILWEKLLKTLWEKEKMLVTSIFSFSRDVFNPIKTNLLKLLSNSLQNNAFNLVKSKVMLLCRVQKQKTQDTSIRNQTSIITIQIVLKKKVVMCSILCPMQAPHCTCTVFVLLHSNSGECSFSLSTFQVIKDYFSSK